MADSLVPREADIRCIAAEPLPGRPRYRQCVSRDTSRFYNVARSGRILSVVQNFVVDSISGATLDDVRTHVPSSFGPPVFEGSDGHEGWEIRWSSDSVCVALFFPPGRASAQLSFRALDFPRQAPTGGRPNSRCS